MINFTCMQSYDKAGNDKVHMISTSNSRR